MKTELVILIVASLGFALKATGVSDSDFFINASLGVLIGMYFVLGFFFFSNEKVEKQYVGTSILAGLFLGFAVIGILMMQFTNLTSEMEPFCYTGAGFSALFSFVSIAKLKKNPNEIYYKKMLLRSGILLIIALYSVTILIQKDYSYYYPAHENSYNSSHDESIQNYNHAPAEAVEEVTEYRC